VEFDEIRGSNHDFSSDNIDVVWKRAIFNKINEFFLSRCMNQSLKSQAEDKYLKFYSSFIK
jgi:hypothetical protein